MIENQYQSLDVIDAHVINADDCHRSEQPTLLVV